MSGLSIAMENAKSSLAANSSLTAIISRNIAGASQSGYSRKQGNLVTTVSGGVQVASVGRATSQSVFYSMLDATSSTAGQDAFVASLNKLQTTVLDTDNKNSLPGKLSALRNALGQFATSPNDSALGPAAVRAAKDLVTTMRSVTHIVQDTRTEADQDIKASVETVNGLLARLEGLNTKIVNGSSSGVDITDALDQRDQVLNSLSQEMGIHVVPGHNNSIAVYADGGATLFETTARTVSFAPTSAFGAATTGNPVLVDGVPVTGSTATMKLTTGRLAGLMQVRDDTAVTYQNQIDEVARGLVEAFRETDQSGGGGPDMAGLFTWSGAPAIPASGTLVQGIAATIDVPASVDADQSGDFTLLRNGNISGGGAAYVYNTSGAAGFSGRLDGLVSGLDSLRNFSPAAKLSTSNSLMDYANNSVSWFSSVRKSATDDQTYRQTLLSRTSEALSNDTGVNVDDQMARMGDLQNSYAASAKLLSAVDSMMQTLLTVVG